MGVDKSKKDVEVVSSGEALRMAATWIEGIQSDMLSTTNYPEASKTGVRHATQFAGLGFSESKANKQDIWKVDKRLIKKTKQTKKRAGRSEALNPVDDMNDSILEGKSESISKRIVNKKSDLLLSKRKKR